jgi:hypothetical protein
VQPCGIVPLNNEGVSSTRQRSASGFGAFSRRAFPAVLAQ